MVISSSPEPKSLCSKIEEITKTAMASVPTTNINYSYDATGNHTPLGTYYPVAHPQFGFFSYQ
jgi:hypothetical protein